METAGSIKQNLIEQSIDFHCHGIGDFDFSELKNSDLIKIENILSSRNQRIILTVYLPKKNFNQFFELLEYFHEGKEQSLFPHIIGIALEGPVLASHGGTPEIGVWFPTESEWEKIASYGGKGLIYSIFSPDVHLLKNYSGPDVRWITEVLLSGGIIPSLGHFLKINPQESAKAVQAIFDVVKRLGRFPIVTDHLYNDMPLNFKHAWRTSIEKNSRQEELNQLDLNSWTLDTLEGKLGPVPAVIIKNAVEGLVKPCINFDGEHVDLDILKKTIELVGAENIMLMTDSIESKSLGGSKLFAKENSSLLYQKEGVVAVGTQGVEKQINNMLSIGLSNEQVKLITNVNPRAVLKNQADYLKKHKHETIDSI